MGKKREKALKQAAKTHPRLEEEGEEEEEEEEDLQSQFQSNGPILKNSSAVTIEEEEEEEGNEDLSLKIVEKALLRACNSSSSHNSPTPLLPTKGGGDVEAAGEEEGHKKEKLRKKPRKRTKDKVLLPMDLRVDGVAAAKDEQNADVSKVVESAETDPVEKSDNLVLRKLLRGPRYFDPPDNGGWGACFNCGKEGHTAVNCSSAKQRRPCFTCGSLEHHAKQCLKGKDCFICKKGGHRAKDCPEKYKVASLRICLRCGYSGHDMFSCKNDYSADDLKEIQCYICKSFGHLCCADFIDTSPREPSCYRCGQLGHSGLDCGKLHAKKTIKRSSGSCFECGEGGHFAQECTSSTKDCRASHGDTIVEQSLGSCYLCGEGGHFARDCPSSTKDRGNSRSEADACFKCGEEGHFARNCSSSAKVHKRNLKLSTSNQKISKENMKYKKARSVPYEKDKVQKRKHTQDQEQSPSPFISKRRSDWIGQHSFNTSHTEAQVHGWGSPVTPTYNSNSFTVGVGNHAGVCHPLGNSRSHHIYFSPLHGRPHPHGYARSYEEFSPYRADISHEGSRSCRPHHPYEFASNRQFSSYYNVPSDTPDPSHRSYGTSYQQPSPSSGNHTVYGQNRQRYGAR